MLCEHLAELEQSLLRANISETYRGQAWSEKCRVWVYFDCVLDIPRLRADFDLASCVEVHEHRGTHDGQELGLVCTTCSDGVMGKHPESATDARVFP